MRSCNFRTEALDEAMFPYVTLAKDKSWQRGPYEGVELLVLHKNEATGGETIHRKLRQGLIVAARPHPLAHQDRHVLSREWEDGGAGFTTRPVFFPPQSGRHGP